MKPLKWHIHNIINCIYYTYISNNDKGIKGSKHRCWKRCGCCDVVDRRCESFLIVVGKADL